MKDRLALQKSDVVSFHSGLETKGLILSQDKEDGQGPLKRMGWG
ncbi:MAG: hypothetical protein QGF31_03015 [Nitrospinota bacterium]|nr:hypothetical protein [Nitrospinota bacterium]